MAGLINNPTTTSTTQVAFATNNARIIGNQYSATDSPSGDTLTIVAKGV
jgi:hypothetical protein